MLTNEYKPIEQLLKDRIGLDPASLGQKAVERAADERMRLLGLAAVPAYAELVARSPAELEALIEMVVIPETWFFRDREPFVFLADFIRSEWKPRHAADTLRILSAPCATGEEPYSIIMTCLDCDLTDNQFVVDAMDINKNFLSKAKNAVYGRNSFRGADLAFRERYFTPEGHFYSLKADVRARARFFKANMIEPGSFTPSTPYDIVFCRNLLIYLHDQGREKIIAAIDRLLATGGLLFVGNAETIPPLMEIFENISQHGSFALRKRTHKPTGLFSPGIMPQINPPPTTVHCGPPSGRAAPAIKPWKETFNQPTPAAGAVERATRLANEGRLKEAEEECRHILVADAGNACAHFLLGIIGAALGNNRAAEDCFNRAIYLDANFADAIMHLAALKEENGDDAGADLLRRRATAINNSEQKHNRNYSS